MADTDTLGTQTGTEQNGTDQAGTNQNSTPGTNGEDHAGDKTAQEEIAKLNGLLSKYKSAVDKLTKEAGDAKKALRAKQSAEEIAAEEKREQDEATQKELEELRKEVSKAKMVKTVMAKLGTDEDASGKIADFLFGAEDADAALTEIQRAWTAREKALRLEFGKIPPPGAGGQGGEDAATQKAINLAKQIGRERAGSAKSVKDALGPYIRNK